MEIDNNDARIKNSGHNGVRYVTYVYYIRTIPYKEGLIDTNMRQQP